VCLSFYIQTHFFFEFLNLISIFTTKLFFLSYILMRFLLTLFLLFLPLDGFPQVLTHTQETANQTSVILQEYPVAKNIVELKSNIYKILHQHNRKLALEYLNKSTNAFNSNGGLIEELSFLIKSPPRTPQPISIEVNLSESSDYHPVVSPDGQVIYFCSQNRKGGTGGEDVFEYRFSQRDNKPKNIHSINTTYNEAPNWISPDSKKMIIIGFYSNSIGGDLYQVDILKNNKLKINRFNNPVNSNYFDCDGQLFSDSIMILVSDRPGGLGAFREKGKAFNGDTWGNTDIYLSVKRDSVWQDVVNLGPVINTDMAERTPYLTPDGKYLFFSSTGHTGFGGLDIFVSKRLSESSWTEWSEPVNLGYSVNSPDDDWGFMIIGDGKTAYFSNTKDIYTCTLPDDFYNFDRQFSLQGKVKNELGKFLNADITLTNLDDNSTLQVSTDSVKGEYRFTLDPFAEYKLVASASGYNPVVQTVSLTSDTVSVLKRDLTLISQSQVRIDTSDGLITVFFEFNKYNLEKSFHPKLDYVANLLQTQSEKSQVTIEIGGYTDAIGSDKYNTKLSLKRAQTVFSELIKRGLEDDFFDVKAYGESDPIAPNNTNEGRAKNRRVVLRIKNSL